MAAVDVSEAVREVETPEEQVFDWRRRTLERSGYDRRLAFKLALREEVDLHLAAALPRRGCPPALAAQILL